MQLSEQGIALIKQFEGFSPQPYLCPAGKWTVGYGHLIHPGEDYSEGLDEASAEGLLRKDTASTERAVCHLVKVVLTQGQFDALVSFAYNVGVGAFSTSNLLKSLNLSLFGAAAAEFPRWCHVGGKPMAGLLKRRLAERAMFCA